MFWDFKGEIHSTALMPHSWIVALRIAIMYSCQRKAGSFISSRTLKILVFFIVAFSFMMSSISAWWWPSPQSCLMAVEEKESETCHVNSSLLVVAQGVCWVGNACVWQHSMYGLWLWYEAEMSYRVLQSPGPLLHRGTCWQRGLMGCTMTPSLPMGPLLSLPPSPRVWAGYIANNQS